MREFGRGFGFSQAGLGSEPLASCEVTNLTSEQLDGLLIHVPMFSGQQTRRPSQYPESRGTCQAYAFDSNNLITPTADAETGLWYPRFTGTQSGNNTGAIALGIKNTNFVFGSSQHFFMNPRRMTWSIWVKVTSFPVGVFGNIFGDRLQSASDPAVNWALGYESSGIVHAFVSLGTSGTLTDAAAGSGISTGRWYMLTGTFDGVSVRLYINGILQAATAVTGLSAASPGNVGNAAGAIYIGGNPQQTGGSESINAMTADARIYNRCLSASELRRQYWNRWELYRGGRPLGIALGNFYNPVVTDALAFSDGATVTVRRGVGATDSLVFSDAASSGRLLSVSASDSIAFGGSGHDQHVPESSSDPLVVADVASIIRSWARSSTSVLVFSDLAYGGADVRRLSVTDTVVFSDLAPLGGVYLKSVTDTLSFSDRGTGFNGYVSVGAVDSLVFSDSSFTGELATYSVGALDQLNFFSDMATGGRAYRAGATDTVVFGDRFLTNGPYVSFLVFTDVATGIVPGQRVFSTLSLTDRADAVARVAGAGNRLGIVLASGVSGRYPFYYCQAPNGTILISNGVDAMLKWDGLTKPIVTAGVVAPATALTIAGDGIGTIDGTYTAYVRFIDDMGNPSNLSPVSDEVSVANVGSIVYTSVPTPTDARIVRRQILRNTDGQADTYYVDIDTTDLTSLSLTSTLVDDVLSTNEAVPILDSDGRPFANRYGIPPSSKAVVESHLGRMFAAVDVDIRDGHVVVTHGSTEVQGVGTNWPETLAGRNLWVLGAPTFYQIESVDTESQTLTLYAAYQGRTDAFSSYAIRPNADEADLVFYSEANLPESWPPVNAFGTQKDGDRITAIVTFSSFLYVFKTRRTYRYSYQSDPAKDGFIFPSIRRGAINRRCIAEIDGDLYALDESGIYSFNGDEGVEPVSNTIQPLFQEGIGEFAMNWNADRTLWHAAVNPLQETIRWFVSLGGNVLPRHAIAFNYRQKRWWIEEYETPISCSCVGTVGFRRSFAGTEARRVIALAEGTLDGVPQAGTLRGEVSSATATSLTDESAAFSTTASVGGTVVIVEGRGRGQQRRIVSATANTLRLQSPWLVLPDTTSVYQLGAIEYHWVTGWFRFTENPEYNHRNLELSFAVLDAPSNAIVELYYDHKTDPRIWGFPRDEDQVTIVEGDSAINIEMSEGLGYVIVQMGSHREQNVLGERFVQIAITGWQGTDPHRYYSVRLDGVEGLE